MRPRADSFGLVLRTIRRVPTTCSSIVTVFSPRSTATVASVTPYAAPRSRVDGGLFIHPKVIDHASLIEIISRSEKVA